MSLKILGVVNPNVRELVTKLDARYLDALKAEPEPWARLVCGFTDSRELLTKFPIDLTALGPGFREWLGPRDMADKDFTSFVVEAEPFERSVRVPLDVAKSPGFAQYIGGAADIAIAAREHLNLIAKKVLQLGKTTALSWDGVSLFNDAHPVNIRDASKLTFDNLFAATPFNRANFGKVKKALRSVKGPDGSSPLGLKLTHILAPTDLEEDIDALFMKRTLANDSGNAADDNIYYQAAQKVIAPELDNEPGVWYAIAANRRARPVELVFADGGDPEMMFLGDGTEFASLTNHVAYLGKLFGGGGAGHPHTIIRCEPS